MSAKTHSTATVRIVYTSPEGRVRVERHSDRYYAEHVLYLNGAYHSGGYTTMNDAMHEAAVQLEAQAADSMTVSMAEKRRQLAELARQTEGQRPHSFTMGGAR